MIAKLKQEDGPQPMDGTSRATKQGITASFKPVALPALVAAMRNARKSVPPAKQKDVPHVLRQEALTD